MTARAVFKIKTGDRGPSVEATLLQIREGVEQAIDLTAAQDVLFLMNSEPPLSAAAVVVDAESGAVRYDWANGDTDAPGQFRAEFEITWTDGRKQTVPNGSYISVYITEDLN